jgi:hypothetical protein
MQNNLFFPHKKFRYCKLHIGHEAYNAIAFWLTCGEPTQSRGIRRPLAGTLEILT